MNGMLVVTKKMALDLISHSRTLHRALKMRLSSMYSSTMIALEQMTILLFLNFAAMSMPKATKWHITLLFLVTVRIHRPQFLMHHQVQLQRAFVRRMMFRSTTKTLLQVLTSHVSGRNMVCIFQLKNLKLVPVVTCRMDILVCSIHRNQSMAMVTVPRVFLVTMEMF